MLYETVQLGEDISLQTRRGLSSTPKGQEVIPVSIDRCRVLPRESADHVRAGDPRDPRDPRRRCSHSLVGDSRSLVARARLPFEPKLLLCDASEHIGVALEVVLKQHADSKVSLLDQGGPLARAARRGGPRPPLAPCLRHRPRRPPPARAAKAREAGSRTVKNPDSRPTASTASRSGMHANSAPVTADCRSTSRDPGSRPPARSSCEADGSAQAATWPLAVTHWEAWLGPVGGCWRHTWRVLGRRARRRG